MRSTSSSTDPANCLMTSHSWKSNFLIAPGVVFAATHIPRQLDSGMDTGEMVGYFAVTAGITFFVLYTLERSRDVIWLGIVHYLMDVAIGALWAPSVPVGTGGLYATQHVLL